MVSIALVALAVSTLVVHGKEVSKGPPVIPPGCEGKTLCDIKPDDYPQEEIDNFFAKNPEYLKRLKREVANNKIERQDLELEEGNIDGNCEVYYNDRKPYLQILDRRQLPKIIVHSSYFDQTIKEVTCKHSPYSTETHPYQCLQALVKGVYKGTECRQVTRQHKLVVYDRKNNKMEEITGYINVDCVCASI